MLSITHANSAALPTRANILSPEQRTHRTRKDAQSAAVLTLGEHAREGFEFNTIRCDGVWRWKRTEEVRAASRAELKTMGGRRGVIAMAKELADRSHSRTASQAVVDTYLGLSVPDSGHTEQTNQRPSIALGAASSKLPVPPLFVDGSVSRPDKTGPLWVKIRADGRLVWLAIAPAKALIFAELLTTAAVRE